MEDIYRIVGRFFGLDYLKRSPVLMYQESLFFWEKFLDFIPFYKGSEFFFNKVYNKLLSNFFLIQFLILYYFYYILIKNIKSFYCMFESVLNIKSKIVFIGFLILENFIYVFYFILLFI